MSRRIQQIVAAVLFVPAALVMAASTGVLVADHFIARHRSPAVKQQISSLETAARSDPSRAPLLAAELDRQTKESLRRASRQKASTGVLIVSCLLFLCGAKWFISLRGQRPPALSTIEEMRGLRGPGSRTKGSGFRVQGSDGASDLKTVSPPPTVGLAFVDDVVAREGRGTEAAIAILQAVQSHYGYLPDEALKRLCDLTEIRPAQIAGVSTFYAQFRRTPAGKHIVKVCHGTACHVSGARQITEELRRHLAIDTESDTDPQRLFTVDKVACLGCCSLAPVMMIDDQTVGRLTPTEACGAIEAFREQEPQT
jgi:NADH:ubiquinone oxidoreductase subunit E